jgi:hypothetical protein
LFDKKPLSIETKIAVANVKKDMTNEMTNLKKKVAELEKEAEEKQ